MKTDTPSPSQHRAKAFSLIELLAVIGLMLLVLKLTLPSLKGLMGNKPNLIARGQLISDLNLARTMALRNGAPVYVVFMPLFQNLDVSPTINEINLEPNPQIRQLMQENRNTQLILLREYLGDDLVNEQIKGVKFPRPKRFNRGNELMGMQLIAYALYAEYLPGDQPSQPSRRWLTDWKKLSDGFYFGTNFIQSVHDVAELSGANRLVFSRLKNGHDDGSDLSTGIPQRSIRLPYIIYNSRGELSARGNPGGMRVGNIQLALTEGGIFHPVKGPKFITDATNQKFEFYGYKIVNADPPSVPAENQKNTWVQINGLTGRANVLETAPNKKEFYYIRFFKMKKDPKVVATEVNFFISKNKMGGKIIQHPWTGVGAQVWGYNEKGMRFFKGSGDPPLAVSGIPRPMLMALILKLKRLDPRLELIYQKQGS
jgi:hypothetical protein